MGDGPRVLEKRLYTATATATGGRNGRVTSDDGILDIVVVPPKAMGGSGAPELRYHLVS
jgi:lipoyl-dependent peroxiredoxin